MINPNKLFQLEGGQQRRKLALCFGALERDILGMAEKGSEYNFSSMTRADYIKALCRVFLKDPKISPETALRINQAMNAQPFDERLACNLARNELLAIIGTVPAEWDLIAICGTGKSTSRTRQPRHSASFNEFISTKRQPTKRYLKT